jgi:hypothetical protein
MLKTRFQDQGAGGGGVVVVWVAMIKEKGVMLKGKVESKSSPEVCRKPVAANRISAGRWDWD